MLHIMPKYARDNSGLKLRPNFQNCQQIITRFVITNKTEKTNNNFFV